MRLASGIRQVAGESGPTSGPNPSHGRLVS